MGEKTDMNKGGSGERFEVILRFIPSDFGEFIRDLNCYGRVLYNGLISVICGFVDNGTGGSFLLGDAF